MGDEDIDTNDDAGSPGEATAETIERAKEMGWVSPEDWKGTPPKAGFLDPAEFVRRGEKVMPLINARARKAEEKVAALEQEIAATRADHRANLDRVERMSRSALEAQRTQIEQKYAAAKEAAVETGDRVAYRTAVTEEKEVTKAFDDRVAEVEKTKKAATGADDAPRLPKAVQDTIDSWLADNSWFNSDVELNALANVHHQKLIKDRPGLTLAENLAEVRKYVAKRFPDKFGSSQSDDGDDEPRGSRVEGGARNGGGGRESQWARVPKEMRQIAEKAGHIAYYLKDGETMEKNSSAARERWAVKYFEGEK